MTFGKHKGKELEELPSSYLRWIVDEVKDEDLAEEAADELEYRDRRGGHFEDD